MTLSLDPKSLVLPPRTLVEVIDRNTLAIVVKRKSRIIMADGHKILDKVTIIKTAHPGINVILKTNAPICSKTLKFFTNKKIEVIQE